MSPGALGLSARVRTVKGNAADFMYDPHSCMVPSADLHLPTMSLLQHPRYHVSRLALTQLPPVPALPKDPEQATPQCPYGVVVLILSTWDTRPSPML